MESVSHVIQRISNIQNSFQKYFQPGAGASVVSGEKSGEAMGPRSTADFDFAQELGARKSSMNLSVESVAGSDRSIAATIAAGNKKRGNGASFFTREIAEVAQKYSLPEALLQSVVQTESDHNPFAVSSKGALGLMQLMPDTAKEQGVENPFDPRQNLEGGAKLLRKLINSYNGDYVKALAAYNAGANSLQNNQLPAYKETHSYIRNAINSYLEFSGVR